MVTLICVIIGAAAAVLSLYFLAKQQANASAERAAASEDRQQARIDRAVLAQAQDDAVEINRLRDEGIQKDRAIDVMTANWRYEKERADRLAEHHTGGHQ